MREPVLIGIAGASGSGKTTLTNQLVARIREELPKHSVAVMREDYYYLDQSDVPMAIREQTNYDDPAALEHSLMLEHLQRLRKRRSVQVPQYDYAVHNRKPETRNLGPADLIVVEGLFILHCRDIANLMDLKVYVDTPLDMCLARRLTRDINERGRTPDSVVAQYLKTVRPGYKSFVEPSKGFSDIIIPAMLPNPRAVDVLTAQLHHALTQPFITGA